jgi:sugar lactone lactonase YvrE
MALTVMARWNKKLFPTSVNRGKLKLALSGVFALLFTLPSAGQAPGTIASVVGDGYNGVFGIPGPAAAAQLIGPGNVVLDKHGNLFVSDAETEQIYKVSAKGKITVFAGSGRGGYSGDGGPAANATFHFPQQLAIGPDGSLYIADSNNNAIRKIDGSTGVISTVAGIGMASPAHADTCGTLQPGLLATKTAICNPLGIAVDSAGNLFILNTTGQVLKVTAATGILTVVAGNGNFGYAGDGGPAVNAELSWTGGIALDLQGNIYIADSGNCAIRKIDAGTRIITSLVGVPQHPWQGTCGLGGYGGPASAALIQTPFGIAVDRSGNVFFSDENNSLVDVIATNGNLYVVAGSYANGSGIHNFTGDGGLAVNATLDEPNGIALDSTGNLYIADYNNSTVRKVIQPDGAIP